MESRNLAQMTSQDRDNLQNNANESIFYAVSDVRWEWLGGAGTVLR